MYPDDLLYYDPVYPENNTLQYFPNYSTQVTGNHLFSGFSTSTPLLPTPLPPSLHAQEYDRQGTANVHRKPLSNRKPKPSPYPVNKANPRANMSSLAFDALSHNRIGEAQGIFKELIKSGASDMVPLAARLSICLDKKGRHEEAEEVVKDCRQDAQDLTKPSCSPTLDITLAIIWCHMGKYDAAEKLLLNMIGKTPDMLEIELGIPSGQTEIDGMLQSVWAAMGRKELADLYAINCWNGISGKTAATPSHVQWFQ